MDSDYHCLINFIMQKQMALFEIYGFLCQNWATFDKNTSNLGNGHVGTT